MKGEIGHFSFEQEVSLSVVAKVIVAGALLRSGYKVAWDKDSFVQIKGCIGEFWLNLDSQEHKVILGNESIKKANTPSQ